MVYKQELENLKKIFGPSLSIKDIDQYTFEIQAPKELISLAFKVSVKKLPQTHYKYTQGVPTMLVEVDIFADGYPELYKKENEKNGHYLLHQQEFTIKEIHLKQALDDQFGINVANQDNIKAMLLRQSIECLHAALFDLFSKGKLPKLAKLVADNDEELKEFLAIMD